MIKEMISIIVPVYNVEAYLEKCIDSILKQTYKNIELILIDDGSTDGSSKICDKAAKKDSRVRVIHKKNSGVSAARNVGLDIAQGEYIGFVDSDDWIAPDMYEQLVKSLKELDLKCVMCEMAKAYDEEHVVLQKFKNGNKIISSKYACQGMCVSIGKEKFSDIKFFYLWDKLYKREIWETLRFDETLRSAEDRWALFQVYRSIGRLGVCSKPLYYYRQNEGLSAPGNKNRDFDYIVGYRMLKEIKRCGEDTRPYIETCIMHTLGRVRACAKNHEKKKYWETHRELKEIWSEAKKLLKNSTKKYRILTLLFRYFPHCLWFIMKAVY